MYCFGMVLCFESDPALIFVRIYVGAAIFASSTMLMIWFNEPHEIAHFSPAYAFLYVDIFFGSHVFHLGLEDFFQGCSYVRTWH